VEVTEVAVGFTGAVEDSTAAVEGFRAVVATSEEAASEVTGMVVVTDGGAVMDGTMVEDTGGADMVAVGTAIRIGMEAGHIGPTGHMDGDTQGVIATITIAIAINEW
jgi:hypothetical protein